LSHNVVENLFMLNSRSINRAHIVWLVAAFVLLLLASCSSDEGLTVRQLEETRVARATEAVVEQGNAVATQEALLSNIAPEGTVFAPEPPDRGHDENLRIPFGELPPDGGTHNPTWQSCGVYEQPIRPENALHSLEHGAVWVTYQTDLNADEVKQLGDRVKQERFGLMSPYPNQRSPIVLTAWGVQLEVDSADDPRIDQFLNAFVQGPQTPERGAACTGGTMDEAGG
jgi:hypothetical protein